MPVAGQQSHVPADEFSVVLATVPVAVLLLDERGGVFRSNERANELWGEAIPSFAGQDEYRKVKGWNAETGKQLMPEDWAGACALRGETVRGAAVELERADGKLITLLFSAAPLHGEDGSIAGAVVIAEDVTQSRKLEEQTKHELSRTQLLLSALGALAGSLKLSGVLSRLVDILFAAGAHSRVNVLLWDEAAAELELAASVGLPRVQVGTRVKIGEVSRFMREALETRQCVIARFEGRPPEEIGSAGRFKLAGSMIAPLVWNDRLLGVVTVDELDPAKGFSDEEIELAVGIANQAALAIENARLYEAQKQQAYLSEVLAQVSLTLTTLEYKQALPLVLEQASTLLGAMGAILATPVPGGWQTTVSYGDRLRGIPDFHSDAESPARRRLLETHEPQLIADVLDDPEVDPELGERLGYRSYVTVPLLVHERVVGALSFMFERPQRTLPPVSHHFLERLQFIVASALETQRLFEERTRHAEYAEALNRINEAVHSTLDFDEIMGRVVVDATKAANLDGAAIHLHHNGYWRFSHTYELPEGLRSTLLNDDEAPLSMMVLNERRVLVIEDVLSDPRANQPLMAKFGIAALLAAPLFVRDEVVGVLFAGCYHAPQRFSEDQVDFMVKVAYTLSLALENSRLYEDEHRVAETLQHALLALPDHVRGVRFAHAYHSASEAAYVGGDFYDVFELEGDLAGVLIGDIAGKGLDAAVLTSLVKNTVRAHAADKAETPGAVLTLTNDVIYKTTEVEAFATVFFGVLDCREGRLRYTNAGHTTAAIVGPGGAVTRLSANSPLVGAFAASEFRQSEARLGEGETLLLYTDGATEARDEYGRLYGEERLFRFVSDLKESDPERLVQAVVGDVMRYASNRLSDDLAVLAATRVPQEVSGPESGTDACALGPESSLTTTA